ncbi:MAG TPA: hypothetical protein VHJ39_04445 [Solirubrobacteraceae bacterium]|nr:hypothetical protein [Solirubrobacteraceae bacterium]
MFPPTTIGRPKKRSLRELVRGAVDTAAAFATLGEAQAPERIAPRAPTAPTREHPHRRPLGRHPRARRPGSPARRAQVCVTPVPHHPARRD